MVVDMCDSQDRPYNFTSDVWSMGVVLYEACRLLCLLYLKGLWAMNSGLVWVCSVGLVEHSRTMAYQGHIQHMINHRVEILFVCLQMSTLKHPFDADSLVLLASKILKARAFSVQCNLRFRDSKDATRAIQGHPFALSV